ncbi:hypothetical protein QE152_g25235 [Popillia japonica]|uniref:Uncharacterized protein n=1 Tax=Popillia japonica TaxID=7064 RepID=A0AAW1K3G8_POPJA
MTGVYRNGNEDENRKKEENRNRRNKEIMTGVYRNGNEDENRKKEENRNRRNKDNRKKDSVAVLVSRAYSIIKLAYYIE